MTFWRLAIHIAQRYAVSFAQDSCEGGIDNSSVREFKKETGLAARQTGMAPRP